MDVKKLSREKLDNLLTLIQLLENERIFYPSRPLQEVEFNVSRLSIFWQAHNQSGFPNERTAAKYNFNYKELFEELHEVGIITINKDYLCLRFLGWKLKTNLQTLLNLRSEIIRILSNRIKQDNENVVEVLVRDAIRNNPTLEYPTLCTSGINISKNDQIKREKIKNCGECDIVCRLNNKIVCIAEITSGAITKDFPERRVPKRKTAAPEAKVWIIGSRINENILGQLNTLGVKVTLLDQLKKQYQNVFHFL